MLEGMDVEGVSSEGLELLLNLKIKNPNPFNATVTDFEYTVEVDGIEVATGGQAREVLVPSEGTVDVEIPSRLAWSGTKDVLESLTVQGKHDWEIHGNLRLKKGILSRKFEFDESGSFEGSLDVELDL
jgi:LEA14-like dessication related protein